MTTSMESLREKRTFRKLGRPAIGENALLGYAEEARSGSMRALILRAARDGLGLKRLAKLCERDPRALAKTIVAQRPHPSNVKAIACALGYPSIVARMLLNEELGELEYRNELLQLLDREGRRVFGEAMREVEIIGGNRQPHVELRRVDSDPYVVAGNVVEWLAANPAALRRAARGAILARYGLDSAAPGAPRHPMLGPVLGAIERVLGEYDLGSLYAFLRDEDHARALQLEARALFRGLRAVLHFTDDELRELQKIVAPKLDKAGTVGADAARFERAIDAMHFAFWQAFQNGDGPLQQRDRA